MSSDPTSNDHSERNTELAEDSGSRKFIPGSFRIFTRVDTQKKDRDVVSDAVAKLRKSMGKTQTSFAVEVLRMAVSTVARYETSQPPRGDVLLLLASISEREGHPELRDTFQKAFMTEVMAKFSDPLEVLIRSFADDDSGYVLSEVWAPDKVYVFQSFFNALRTINSLDPKTGAQVAPAISVLTRDFWANLAKIFEDASLAGPNEVAGPKDEDSNASADGLKELAEAIRDSPYE